MKSLRFTKEEIDKINRAAATVESKSSGEVLTAVIEESSNYAFAELLFSLVGGFLVYTVLMFFHSDISGWLESVYWNPPQWWVTAFYGGATLVTIGVLYMLSNIPGFDRLIVSKQVQRKFVYRRAMLHFAESGAVNTVDRTGILFFISIRERMVEIIADEGINSKVEPGVWDDILTELVSSIKVGDAAAGIEGAISACGDILERHFPVQADDVNELPDGIVFLED